MPILNIQRRMAEQGRIRLGQKVPVGTSGKSRPGKLDRFRFTSPNQRLIESIAGLYGGQAQPWDNGGRSEFEVLTEARSIPVIVVKGGMSQWMETWSGGGCVHRCDGVTNVLTDSPCDPDDPAHLDAKPTTRLSVMLRDVESLGVWRMESHGWNAAAEIPAMAELAMQVGDLVPATLHLVERKAIRDGKTSRFVVPVLDLEVSKQRLVEIVSGQGAAPQIGPAAVAQIGAAAEPDIDDLIDLIADATSKEDLNSVWRKAGQSGRLTDDVKARIIARGGELDEESSGEVVEAVVEPEGDVDSLWQQIVAEAGRRGMSNSQLVEAVEQEFGLPTDEVDAEQFAAFLVDLKAGRVAA